MILLGLILFALALCSASCDAAEKNDVVAAVVIMESGGEGIVGMHAVVNVIQNRPGDMYSVVTKSAIVKPKSGKSYRVWQFSCMVGKTEDQIVEEAKKHPRFSDAKVLVELAFVGGLKDITNGATHYHTPQVKPYWTAISVGGKNKKAEITLKLGNHIFLKNVD